ncbi:MAG: ExbD/TolR family protein [Proteobacteria bacterium]|nr:ExbD/TolR family protein [Pseudomonadota bacterium]MBS0216585.1 ExbD/TolR family protein [Pseudomonadota bacterium]MBS0225466.1 ExbD/TolR family protein [Pseudomonadota bacterium]
MAARNTSRRRKHRLKSEINVVPYIDVMLVLLIIFMATAPLLNLGVDVDLPQSSAQSIQVDVEPAIVSVDAEGALSLTIDGTRTPSSRDEVVQRVQAFVAAHPKAPVYVAGDGKASYQTVYDVLSLLQTEAHVPRAGLMSMPSGASAK